VDYSAPSDGWSKDHDAFVKAMNERKCALYFSWGPFGPSRAASRLARILETEAGQRYDL